MPRKLSLSGLRKKAWKLMSLKVRREASDHRGHVICVSCGKDLPANESHAGHFIHISKQHPLSYDDRNIHPQCAQCNVYGHKGMAPIQYTMWLVRKYGIGIVQELTEMKKLPYLKRHELEDLCITLQSKS